MQYVEEQCLPFNEWKILETDVDSPENYLKEYPLVFGSDYIGLPSAGEEFYTSSLCHSLNTHCLRNAVVHPSLDKSKQYMLNVPNVRKTEIYIGNERLDLSRGILTEYQRSLNLRTGILRKAFTWESPGGKRLTMVIECLSCSSQKHLVSTRYCITPLNFTGLIEVVSALDGGIESTQATITNSQNFYPNLETVKEVVDGNFAGLLQESQCGNFALVSAIEHKMLDSEYPPMPIEMQNRRLQFHYTVSVASKRPIRFVKYSSYFSSCDYPSGSLLSLAKHVLAKAKTVNFEDICGFKKDHLDIFWQRADVVVEGDAVAQWNLRCNQYRLFQAVMRDQQGDDDASDFVTDRYNGHYNWDTEVYRLPFFLYTQPELTRKILEYRYSLLDQARSCARQMSHGKGALYLLSALDNDQCSCQSMVHYHINADMAYSIKSYLEVTGDYEYLLQYGAEIVWETARIWIEVGNYSGEENQQFCIYSVNGPDEYRGLVDNNYYTNAMAKMHLNFAVEVAELLQRNYADNYALLAEKITLREEEITQWRRAATAMYLPFDRVLGIHVQDDTFVSRPLWNPNGTELSQRSLLSFYHPSVLYRHQVCKRADVLLAMLLLGGQYRLEEKIRNFEYYENITTHESYLSLAVFSIMASEIGYRQKAYDYFTQCLSKSFPYRSRDTEDDMDIASMTSAWLCLVYGFAGMRTYTGTLQFVPFLPQAWQRYCFRIYFKQSLVEIDVGCAQVSYTLLEGDTLEIQHRQQTLILQKNKTQDIDL